MHTRMDKRTRMHKRTHSDEYITGLLGSDPKRNRNVEWLNTPYLLPAYMFFIALFYGVVRGTELVDAGGAWAFTNVVHGSLTFVVLHWWKVRGVSRAKGAMNAGLNQARAGGVRRQSARDPLTIRVRARRTGLPGRILAGRVQRADAVGAD